MSEIRRHAAALPSGLRHGHRDPKPKQAWLHNDNGHIIPSITTTTANMVARRVEDQPTELPTPEVELPVALLSIHAHSLLPTTSSVNQVKTGNNAGEEGRRPCCYA